MVFKHRGQEEDFLKKELRNVFKKTNVQIFQEFVIVTASNFRGGEDFDMYVLPKF